MKRQDLVDYLKEECDSVQQALDALCDGELLGKLEVTQEDVEAVYEAIESGDIKIASDSGSVPGYFDVGSNTHG